MQLAERRKSLRVPVWLVINEVVSVDTGEVLAKNAVTQNVSVDGMEIEVYLPESRHELVELNRQLRLSVYLVDTFVTLQARIARQVKSRGTPLSQGLVALRLGLEFREVSATLRRQLERLLERSRPTVLVVDDEASNREIVTRLLRTDCRVLQAADAEEAGALLASNPVNVIVSDQSLPGRPGIEFLDDALTHYPQLVGILLTALDPGLALQALNGGKIYRYLTKPVESDELVMAVRNAVERQQMLAENRRLVRELFEANDYLRSEVDRQWSVDEIVGADGGLADVLEQARRISASSATVLITGESGTGKELMARAIHHHSIRRAKPLVRFNCAALSESLLESELFGHEKGAFTGAVERRAGRFELADGGTLFLDEIGDIPLRMQVKLLRVLQEREFERVGGNQTIKVDIRVIAATNQDLAQLVSAGRFRADLYYRLNVINIHLPPLRARPQDVPKLINHLLRHFSAELHKPVARLTPEALAALSSYPWPGNVRELKNEVERIVALCEPGGQIGTDLLSKGRDRDLIAAAGKRSLHDAVDALERELIMRALEECQGNQVHAAKQLGLSREGLRRKLRRFGSA